MTKVTAEDQRELALSVLRRLRAAGYTALWAGGCVRDQLLNRTPNDYDVATSATPPEIRSVFGRRHTLEIGAAFGVIAVIGPHRSGMVEVTTFRKDAEYSDGRHPDAVIFSSPEDDAQRRDFTINGLFYDPIEDRVIDYVGGLEDLRLGLIRAIGDPRARFSEDKLRMLRAVRIAAAFDFAIDPATADAIVEMADTIQVVSPERIAQEMRKMLVHARRAEAVDQLRRTRLLSALLPELLALLPPEESNASSSAESQPTDLWQHTGQVLSALPNPSFSLALAALVHALKEQSSEHAAAIDGLRHSPAVQAAEAICTRWKLSNKEHDHALWLLAHHGRLSNAASQPWSSIQPLLINPEAQELIALHEADDLHHAAEASRQAQADAAFCRAKLKLPVVELDPPPLVDGNDLQQHCVPKGPIYRRLLEQVRAAQLDGQVQTRADALALVDRLLAGESAAP